jgi:hypothetical protein
MGYTLWPWRELADPLATIIIILIIVSSTLPLVRRTVDILLEKAPDHVDLLSLRAAVERVRGVISCHDLHVWQLDSERVVAMVHVLLDRKLKDFDGTGALDNEGALPRNELQAPAEADGSTCAGGSNVRAPLLRGAPASSASGTWRAAVDAIKLEMHRHGVHASAVQPEFVSESTQHALTSGHGAGGSGGGGGASVVADGGGGKLGAHGDGSGGPGVLGSGAEAAASASAAHARFGLAIRGLSVCNEPVCDDACESKSCCDNDGAAPAPPAAPAPHAAPAPPAAPALGSATTAEVRVALAVAAATRGKSR